MSMSDEERGQRIARALLEEMAQGEPRWWWMSFCDADRPEGDQFLGVSLVFAAGMATATHATHATGCNPGGSVMGMQLPKEADPPSRFTYRLLTRAEILELDEIFKGQAIKSAGSRAN